MYLAGNEAAHYIPTAERAVQDLHIADRAIPALMAGGEACVCPYRNPPAARSGRDDLVRHLSKGCKPKADWRIGTEHEKFVYDLKTHKPLAYEGTPGIRAAAGRHAALRLEAGAGRREHHRPVAERRLAAAWSRAASSNSPARRSRPSIETCAEVNTHLEQIREVAGEIGAGVLGLGFAPTWRWTRRQQMPKGRYKIMRRYMPKVGGYGLDMMFRTCTVQVNLDFSSEADMVKKFRVGLALQPVTTALFANSPFREGKPSGFLSYRAQVWTDVDNARAGMLPWVFEDGMSFERYVDYALDVPMYFVYRDGKYIDVAGKSFRDFLAHKIPEVTDIEPTMTDWADHLTTIFPEVRLKTFLEMRGTDGGQLAAHLRHAGAVGRASITTRPRSMRPGTWSRTGRRKNARRCASAVPELGFKTPFRKTTVLELAHRMLEISSAGLAAPRRAGRRRHERGRLPQSAARAGGSRLHPRRGTAEELSRRMEPRPLAIVYRI